MQRYCVPTVICFSLVAGSILGWPLGLWRVSPGSSTSMALVACVSTLSTFVTIPWILSEGYKPVLISSIFFGAQKWLVAGATGVARQREELRPDGVLHLPHRAGHRCDVRLQIRAHGIGKKSEGALRCCGGGVRTSRRCGRAPPLAEEERRRRRRRRLPAPDPRGAARVGRVSPSNWWRWIGSGWPLATWLGVVAMCTWTVSRAVMASAPRTPYAAHPPSRLLTALCPGQVGHHLCHHMAATEEGPAGCTRLQPALDPSDPANQTACAAASVCSVFPGEGRYNDDGSFECKEDKGEYWLESAPTIPHSCANDGKQR